MRVKAFIGKAYFLRENPFPPEAIVSWGGNDPRSNGSLYDEEVFKERYEEGVIKFIVNPIDTHTKFHFLWSLGSGDEARGFGKTATLHYLARSVNRDLGYRILTTHDFDEMEARETPILAAMATFDTQKVTTLAGVSLEHVRYLVQEDDGGDRPLSRVRERLKKMLAERAVAGQAPPEEDDAWLAGRITDRITETELAIRGKTIGAIDKKFVQHFANGDFRQLQQYLSAATPRIGYELLHTVFVMARATGVRRVFLLIDQVEDFASADVPKKRRHMEVERFRDLAIETQPFGEMASYVLTMHPAAAYTIEEYWSLARLPKMDFANRQNERVTVVLKALETPDQVARLLRCYLDAYRVGTPPDPLFPLTMDGIELIRRLAGGRPGEILRRANRLIDDGAANQTPLIDGAAVKEFFSDERRKAEASPQRRAFGALDE